MSAGAGPGTLPLSGSPPPVNSSMRKISSRRRGLFSDTIGSMEQPQTQFNIHDVLIGLVLILVLPLVTYAFFLPSDEPKNPAGKSGEVLPLKLEELNLLQEEYQRMFEQNALLFIIRAKNPRFFNYRSQELAWARSVLDRCHQGFSGLLERAKKRPASRYVEDRIPNLELWIQKVELQLRGLSAIQLAPVAPSP